MRECSLQRRTPTTVPATKPYGRKSYGTGFPRSRAISLGFEDLHIDGNCKGVHSAS